MIALFLWVLMFFVSNYAHAIVKNSKPLAVVGNAQSVVINTPVVLDGSLSHDSDGNIKKWQWTQTKGIKVKLVNPKQSVASFTSPAKLKVRTTSTVLVFKLTVTDNKNATASATVPITVTLEPICVLPQVLEKGVCVTPPPECVQPQTLVNGVCVEHKVVCSAGQLFLNGICMSPLVICKAPQILKNAVCITPKFVCKLPLVLQNGQCVTPGPSFSVNDTGILDCSDGAYNVSGCANKQFPWQDAEFGRDVSHYNDSDGIAGFSFTKISAMGAALPLDASEWACVKDNVTGLLWENKTHDGGLHDKSRSFSNYSLTFNPKNEYGSATDATGFAATVNAQGTCGVNNWRLPTTQELQGIVNFGYPLPGPSIDQNFFSDTLNSPFWSGSPLPRATNSAWLVYFDDGRIFDDVRNRNGGAAVRLVSGGPVSQNYAISDDGQEVMDHAGGLIWKRCVEGKTWNGYACVGSPLGFMFQEALQRAEAVRNDTGKNWRIPNIKELTGLIDTSQTTVAINQNLFPNTQNDQHWSSSSFTTDAFFAWVAHFFYGSVYYTYTEDTAVVRLVRDKE
ncbi:MAG: DUF1566 domain-containing protein [Methylococcales bacterium]|nr:DUF1566 domain-containing protein [Methylococcales bacterium]